MWDVERVSSEDCELKLMLGLEDLVSADSEYFEIYNLLQPVQVRLERAVLGVRHIYMEFSEENGT